MPWTLDVYSARALVFLDSSRNLSGIGFSFGSSGVEAVNGGVGRNVLSREATETTRSRRGGRNILLAKGRCAVDGRVRGRMGT